MPKRQATNQNNATAAAAAKKSKKGTGKQETDDLPMEEWRVVLTGDFVVKAKALLEQELKNKGVAVTGSVSGKTTHLILGKSGVNEYGKKTGVGSSKYNQAVEKGLAILSETEVWAVLSGTVSAQDLSEKKQAAKIKASKNSSLADKILSCVQDCGSGGKISLAKLKKELGDRFEMNMENTRSKNSLKKALDNLLQEGKIQKEGASYKTPELVHMEDVAAATIEWNEEDETAVNEQKLVKYCPESGRWRGLYMISTKKPSGRASCKACGQPIEKGGDEQQMQVSDDSLFRMCVWPEDVHEGVSRDYIESGYPGYNVISRSKFFIHSGCQQEAERKFEAQFHKDWKKVRPHELEARRG
uniref:H15 domain-containing protein n=1 Tax=Entomoneis paludosa TaxID=265537 RepID=A0A7S3DXH8_9STRA|mmetsp:Transcript_745/g.1793  ORF Transcript_745/g.1793 Transcript_745/m.1793 type:complete len:357 (+) Transcript_745:1129-2199(+)